MDKEQLAKLAEPYRCYDGKYCLDTFHKIHWGTVKGWLDDPQVRWIKNKGKSFHYGAILKKISNDRKVADFTRINQTMMRAGEWQCLMFAYQDGSAAIHLADRLEPYRRDGIWFTRVNQENPRNRSLMDNLPAKLVSVKVAGSGADIYGIYYAGPRDPTPISGNEEICFAKYKQEFDPKNMAKRLLKADLGFSPTERGTAYGGPAKTWTRVIVRASGDSRLIADKQIRNHPAMKAAPELVEVMESLLPLRYLDAIMLTRVTPKDGVILRHTDFALDKQFIRGITPGHTMRIHIVIQGNPKCYFHIWDIHGRKQSVAMETGDIWYTDVRKPHAVDNGGDTERIHLVCDYFATPKLYKRFARIIP